MPAKRLIAAAKGRWFGAGRSRYAEFLPHARAVVESTPPVWTRLVVFAVAALVLTGLWWAGVAQVDQVVTAQGIVRPAGKIKIINHAHGGRIERIHVAEGDRVESGQPLFALDATIIGEEIAKRTQDWQSFSAEVSRLEAEVSGKELLFDAEVYAARPDLVLTQRQQFETRRRALEARRAETARTVDRLKSEHEAAVARERRVARSREILSEQRRSISSLAEKGFYPRLKYLSVEREANEMAGQHDAARTAVHSAASSLAEAEARLAKIGEDWRADVLARLTMARRERDRARSALLQQSARESDLVVRAPIAGVIQGLTVTAAGQSVSANTPLMSIVPVGVELLVEAVVSNADIGQIAQDQKSSVKVKAFDFLRYGTLDGRVERIAADSTQNPRTLQHGYAVTIRTDRAYLTDGEARLQVHPGMEAQVELHIGKRSILSYLTDRLRRTTATTFRER
jgi:HlyD family type I secretion membrane fusion protein